jgi:DNA mismatch endonuclease (patch repair protein)
MTDVFTPEKRSEVMSRIRSRGNRDTELKLAKLFRQHHITGWRRHLKLQLPSASPIPGLRSGTQEKSSKFTVHPDFVFLRPHVAIFVDGCFWHSCPKHSNLPVNNRDFWEKKFMANKARDKLVNRLLRKIGWQVIRIWEHDLEKQSKTCIRRVALALQQTDK